MEKSRVHAALSLAFLLAWCTCALALDPSLDVSQYAHTSWRAGEALPGGLISSITQTPDGYLWLGTEFGLLRFDGVRAVPWQPPANQHLPSVAVNSLLVTTDGTLWIGTWKGLASWKDGRLTRYPALDGLLIMALVQGRDGTVWAGGFAANGPGKLCAIQNGDARCYGQDGTLGKGPVGLYEDHSGNLWVGVLDGLWRWKPGAAQFYPIRGEVLGIQRLAEGEDGALLIAARGRVARFDAGKLTDAYPYPQAARNFFSRTLLHDRDGSLWVGTLGGGIVHVHRGTTNAFTHSDGLSHDGVTALFQDREGNVWVGSDGGLDRFRDFTVVTFSTDQGFAAYGSVLVARDGTVWQGASDGLHRWDHGQVTIYHPSSEKMVRQSGISSKVREVAVHGLPKYEFVSLSEGDRGRIWVVTSGGVGYLQNDHFTPINTVPAGIFYSSAANKNGDLWIANWEHGLLHVHGDSLIRQIPWSGFGRQDFATALTFDPQKGGVWLGFSKGGLAYFSDGQVPASYTPAEGLGEGRVNDLRFDHEGALWAATESGLSRMKNGRIVTLTSKNGLPCDIVHWAIEDEGRSLWLYMPCGLVRIARPELDAWVSNLNRNIQITVFNSSDGVSNIGDVPTTGMNVAKSLDGRVWFATYKGLSVIDPHHLPFNNLPPPVHIEQVIADDKPYDATNGLRLPAGVRNLAIDYTALSLVAPEKVRFRYKLEGQDKNWHEVVNDREVQYTNLAPKHYRFRVLASNNSALWNEEGARLDFMIPPMWYQTNWFRAACVAAFLAMLWGLYEMRLRQLSKQEEKFREAVETMPGLAFVANSDGNRSFVNKGVVDYTGIPAEQALGSGWQAAIHPDDLKRVLDKWRTSLERGEAFDYESRLHGANGTYRWFQTRVVPLRDKQGKVVKWCGLATDIEDRKRAEQLQAELTHTNRVTMLGELAASIAHEVNQPLAGMVNQASASLRWLARDVPNLEEASEAARKIIRDGKRAGEIIHRLRALYKKATPKRELVDVNEIIGEMAAMLRSEAHRFAVSIRMDLAADLPTITADRVQLQQVLMNLMLNGIEAMKETGGVLTLTSQPQDGRLLISVSDTGVGLPPKKADKIFEAFFTTKPQGSGMGLAISRSIIESHGGRLWATPNDGCGAAFHFSLPLATEIAIGT